MIRAAVLGFACGLRSTSGPAAIALTTPTGLRFPRPLSSMSGRLARLSTGAAALGELVGDKSPKVPRRTLPPVLAGRAVSGAASALAMAQRDGGSRMRWALAGALGAVGGSYAGVTWRALAAERLGSDLPGALIEDGATLALAVTATRS